ncbi:MAG: AAA family ATPase, partial [Microthrixaceae bacterium]
VQKFRNFVEPQRIEIEDDVTAFVGKNESGKTTVLKALHRLNPANGDGRLFDVVTEYPRWLLIPDGRKVGDLKTVRPVTAEFVVTAQDIAATKAVLPAPLPADAVIVVSRSYGNKNYVEATAPLESVIRAAATVAAVEDPDTDELLQAETLEAASTRAKDLAKELREGAPARAKALSSFSGQADRHAYLVGGGLEQEGRDAIAARVPKFFYFSDYSLLPGERDLTELARLVENEDSLSEEDETMVSLLARANVAPSDFLDDNYDSRKAQLQAAGGDLSREVFKYWGANTDLAVVFDDDNVEVAQTSEGNVVNHRILKIELRDARHGDVQTNFSSRSAGFQWFFSFFAAFSEYQNTNDPVIVLLDEPGTRLHGEAQKDFLDFIYTELGASKQTLYTTHSQFMIDPTKYEKLRAVHDKATRDNQEEGVAVTPVSLSADPDTILPVESALGYTVSQHLFLGSGHHLLVEGSSDFVFLTRMSAYMEANGKTILSPKLAIIPVGGITNMPAFVALMGRRLRVSVLVDGEKSSSVLDRTRNAARDNGVDESKIVNIADVEQTLPKNADVEDLFDPEDYVQLFNWAFKKDLTTGQLSGTGRVIGQVTEAEGAYDHALPAHALVDNQDEFFKNIRSSSVKRFETVIGLLNATL